MSAIESPCILVCVIEQNSGYCYGCGRTSTEIAEWSTMNIKAQTALKAELPSRVATLERKPRRKTRRRQMTEHQNRVRSSEETA